MFSLINTGEGSIKDILAGEIIEIDFRENQILIYKFPEFNYQIIHPKRRDLIIFYHADTKAISWATEDFSAIHFLSMKEGEVLMTDHETDTNHHFVLEEDDIKHLWPQATNWQSITQTIEIIDRSIEVVVCRQN